jgi:hypothetical protein
MLLSNLLTYVPQYIFGLYIWGMYIAVKGKVHPIQTNKGLEGE